MDRIRSNGDSSICFITNSVSSSDESEMVPAFLHTYDARKEKKIGVLRAQPSLYRLIKKLVSKAEAPSFKMPARELPMLVPPRPWTGVTEGGYLVSPGFVVVSL